MNDPIQRAIDWIEENLRANITAEDAAREAGFSVYHFCHLFAAATGLPVMQFITQRRLRHAAYAIAHGALIIDTALEFGFDSASGFTRAFRREFGMSPRKYAKSAHPLPPAKVVLKELNHIMIQQKLISRVLNAWNMTDSAQNTLHSSGVRSENTFQIGSNILHVRESRAPLALAIIAERCLRAAGLPAPKTIPTADGADIQELDALFFRLAEPPFGSFIPARRMYEALSYPRAVGVALAHLHRALKPLENLPELNRPNLLTSTLDWSLPQTAQAMNLPSRFVQEFSDAFAKLFPSLPVAVIHRNPTPDAFLFENGRLSGYANFEMTEVNIRLFDICYAATAILSETLGRLPEETVSRWPELLRAIIDGYSEVSPLTESELAAVPYAVCAVQMVCVAYFSGKERFKQLAEVNVEMTKRIIQWLLPETTD